jgi:DNA-binding MarR family transcriptional regulator
MGRILGNALRRFDARVLELMAQDEELPLKWGHYLGRGVVTAAQLHMVRHLQPGGGRLVDMAKSAGMTKQAMKNLIDQCQAMGLMERTPKPDAGDRRCRFLTYTQTGLLWRQAFLRAVEKAEKECEQELGVNILTVIRLGLEAYGHAHDTGYAS